MSTTEQRRYLRQETDIPITICKDEEKIPATMIDISEGGIAIVSERGLFPGAEVDIIG
ncbi:MAG: PilZ domain-containing protein [Desulfobacterales bacterium]|nr:PilZ domain-containing protein [Desulfobacterales bacterium]